MKERWRILELWQRLQATAAPQVPCAVLVTLVDVRGSSYRRPGAHLLAADNGSTAGTISGGCLEGEVTRKAAWHVRSGAHVERYSTLFDDTAEIPYGLGCGGEVDLLYEPAEAPEGTALLAAMADSLHGAKLLAATLLPEDDHPMLRVIWVEDGALQFRSAALTEADLAAAKAAGNDLLVQQAGAVTLTVQVAGKARSVYIERILPPPRLLVFGAGEDARPVVEMATQLGWRTVVADGRAHLAQAKRFPLAGRVVLLEMAETEATAAFAGLKICNEDAVVLLTHSYEQDRWLLQRLLPLEPQYIGLLGARHRSRLLLQESAAALGWSGAKCLARVHAPIGLDLGGDAPEAVALAIVAEVQACLHAREAKSRSRIVGLRDTGSDLPYVPVRCALEAHDPGDR
jgi:xanthine/CO dehydrogenase XdhC/CoxF family maturation factor